MCTLLILQEGAIALLGDYSTCGIQIKDLSLMFNLFIQYGNHPLQPLQIQVDKQSAKNQKDKLFYVSKLKETEINAIVYDDDKKTKL